MINNIRIKNQPLFKEFTFHEQDMERYVLVYSVPYNQRNLYVDNILHSEVELTSFEYKILGKVFDYEPNSNIFTREDTEGMLWKLREVLAAVTEIVKVMSLDEVEFIEVDRETFDKWLTFREWWDIVGEDWDTLLAKRDTWSM